MSAIEDTLKDLDRWYNDVSGEPERPKLLAKLAILELCGWIEHRLDSMIVAAGLAVGVDKKWIEDNILKQNHGFTYQDHLRKMLVVLIGESGMTHLEETCEKLNPALLDKLKSDLTTLRNSRGLLAHSHTGSALLQQQTVNAPSWAINQHRILSKNLDRFEATFISAFRRTIGVP